MELERTHPAYGSQASCLHCFMSIEGFILTGGASTRMGADKARLKFGGQDAVTRIAQALSAISLRVSTVGGALPHSPGLGHVPDIHPQWGALGGIHAALSACREEWAAIVACDLPFVTRDLLARLQALAESEAGATPEAVVPIQSDGRTQSLCALYRSEPCLLKTEEMIGAGEHTPRALLAAITTRFVQFDELADLADAEHFFFNMNSPEDYERAKRILGLS